MGLNAAMEIGKSGMKIYQVATEVVSENIANVNTPGYSRQRTILHTAPPSTANGFPLGTGVRISTVERLYDGLLQKQLVNGGAVTEYDNTTTQTLQQIEPIFNEISQDGLGAAITGFFNSWEDLSLNPTGQAERQAVIGKAQILVDQFHYIDSSINSTIALQEDSIKPQAGDINLQLQDIAKLNELIRSTELVYGNANEMRDERDYLVRQLSEKIGIKYTENTDGTTDIFVTDNSVAVPTDYYLVKGAQYGKVNAAGTPAVVTVTDYLGATSSALDPTAATPFYATDTAGGKLWATLKTRDVTLPDYLNQVDTLAAQLVTSVNAVHTAGRTPANVAGVNFFTPAAAATAATITLNISLTTQIAAAAGPPATFAAGDNTNALAMSQLLNTNTMSAGTATFSQYYDSLVAQIGLDVQTSKTVYNRDVAYMKQLTTLRDSNSGVSLDEELTDLIKFQRSYQASAKLITTATEMLDVVIGLVN